MPVIWYSYGEQCFLIIIKMKDTFYTAFVIIDLKQDLKHVSLYAKHTYNHSQNHETRQNYVIEHNIYTLKINNAIFTLNGL